MSRAIMMPPDEMKIRYGLLDPVRARRGDLHAKGPRLRPTPAQQHRIRKKLRRIYGMTSTERDQWIDAARRRGMLVR